MANLEQFCEFVKKTELGSEYLLSRGRYCALGAALHVAGVPDESIDGGLLDICADYLSNEMLDTLVPDWRSFPNYEMEDLWIDARDAAMVLYGSKYGFWQDIVNLNDGLSDKDRQRGVLEYAGCNDG